MIKILLKIKYKKEIKYPLFFKNYNYNEML